MKFLTAFIIGCSFLSAGFAVAQEQPKSCHCKNCKCTPQSHCGCYSDKGCSCAEGCECGSSKCVAPTAE